MPSRLHPELLLNRYTRHTHAQVYPVYREAQTSLCSCRRVYRLAPARRNPTARSNQPRAARHGCRLPGDRISRGCRLQRGSEYVGVDEDEALRLLLSPQTIAADKTALMDILSLAADRSWVEREAAYRPSGLNAHLLEKPLHALLDAYTQHKPARRGSWLVGGMGVVRGRAKVRAVK